MIAATFDLDMPNDSKYLTSSILISLAGLPILVLPEEPLDACASFWESYHVLVTKYIALKSPVTS